MDNSQILFRVENLKKYFPIKSGIFSKTIGHVHAVDGISFDIKRGETLGLVGESGCGKSTTGLTILKLLKATEGKVFFQDKDIFQLSKKEIKKMRTDMQIVFQDPYSSLNPRMTVGEIVGEAIKEHKIAKGKELNDKVTSTLEKCGLDDYHMKRYPHEFSGGQRQRICIARALALEPKFIVADEAVSALDVSIQSQIINLLLDLKEKMELTYLFISHDLSVVKFISDNIGVMYLGKIVEYAQKKELFDNPLHPYTRALFSAIPASNPRKRAKKIILEGDIPSPANPPAGCRFHTRCPYKVNKCTTDIPLYKEVSEGHYVACHLI